MKSKVIQLNPKNNSQKTITPKQRELRNEFLNFDNVLMIGVNSNAEQDAKLIFDGQINILIPLIAMVIRQSEDVRKAILEAINLSIYTGLCEAEAENEN